MKKTKIFLFILLLAGIAGCNTNEPVKYTTWHCTETSAEGTRTFLIDIYRSSADTTIYALSNFHNISHEGDYDIRVQIKKNALTFSPCPQQIGLSQNIIKSGDGTANSSFTRIDMNYTIYDGKNDILYQAVLTR